MKQATLNKIKDLDILDVAAKLGISIVSTQGGGKKCKCFMHTDNHPSIKFWPSNNSWYCFVCEEGGSQIDLVMKHENLEYPEACKWLIKEFGITEYSDSQYHTTLDPSKFMYNSIDSKLSTLSSQLISKSQSSSNDFCRSLVQCGILTIEQMRNASERYHLGSTQDNGVIFWQIDQDQQVHEGKVMYYQADCHRSHTRNPVTISWLMKNKLQDTEGKPLLPKGWKYTHCLFGMHLVTEGCNVAIVESEKTAVICSEKLPEFIWLTTGGSSFLTTAALQQLVQLKAKIIIFPDTDTDGSIFNKWKYSAEQASKALNYPFPISNLLELHATEDQKKRKIDIADFILDSRSLNS